MAVIIVGFILMLFGFIVRSQIVSFESERKYGMKIWYILCLLLFGFIPVIGIGIGLAVNIINITELSVSSEQQTNKFVIFLTKNSVADFFDRVVKFLNKSIFVF